MQQIRQLFVNDRDLLERLEAIISPSDPAYASARPASDPNTMNLWTLWSVLSCRNNQCNIQYISNYLNLVNQRFPNTDIPKQFASIIQDLYYNRKNYDSAMKEVELGCSHKA